MTSPIEFDPQLCELSDGDLDRNQRNLILAFLPYLGALLSGSEVSHKAYKLVADPT